MKFSDFSPQQASAGIGLRAPHYTEFLQEKKTVPWLEVHAENFLNFNTPVYHILENLRKDYPISLHGMNLSLGSGDGIDEDHVRRVKDLIDRLDPFLISEPLSWGRVDDYYLNDCLTIPYNQETLTTLRSNVSQIQDILDRSLLIENPASYLQYQVTDMEEADFLTTLVTQTGSGILLNLNNLYVSCSNHSWDIEAYLKAIPAHKIKEIHLGGHHLQGSIHIADHGGAVCEEMWNLYQKTIRRIGPVLTLVEWNTNIPPLNILMVEAEKAQRILDSVRVPSNIPGKERHALFA